MGSDGMIAYFNSETWTNGVIATDLNFCDVWGTADDNVYAVSCGEAFSRKGDIYHYDGVSWSEVKHFEDMAVNTVFGTSASDIFVAGDYGRVYHFDGDSWSQMLAIGSNFSLMALHGNASNNIYSVDAQGRVAHYDGQSWTVALEGTGNVYMGFHAVWVDSSGEIFVGGQGRKMYQSK